MKSKKRRDVHEIGTGLLFLAPNIIGFLTFTLIPLVFSLMLSFTNWDIRLHNIFNDEPIRFVGFENFVRLFQEPEFLKYFGNTLFFMMGIPFGVGGSLLAAILLSQDLRGGSRRIGLFVVATALLTIGVGALIAAGSGPTALMILILGIAGVVLFSGSLGGQSVYRTLFYFPHFTAGVATFLLWKKLYNPHAGPINNALRGPLARLGSVVNTLSPGVVQNTGWICAGLMVILFVWGMRNLRHEWQDGEMGLVSVVTGMLLLCLPSVWIRGWLPNSIMSFSVLALAGIVLLAMIIILCRKREFTCPLDRGIGYAAIFCGLLMVLQFALLGLANVFHHLPRICESGLEPPEWLSQYYWAKPSLMIMGLWAAIGSNGMLLYLAGLSNIPPELYEASDIDGANRFQRFRHVTWPQLAPITFFILVMSIIGGLQGGFEMARTMTQGGPAGATTTLSYYVYIEGFEWGRLGYASAVAWVMFLLIVAITIFNWKFGNRYVNE